MVLLLAACVSQSIGVVARDSGVRAEADTAVEVAPGDSAPDSGEPPPEPDADLYASGTIHALTLDLPDDSYVQLQRNGRDYVLATLGFQGASVDVAIRIKGSSSWQPIDDKPSLIVDVNYFDPEQEFLGVKKFYLHNDCYDPSQMSSTLAYGFYRAWGYPASRTGFAQLELDGRDYGLYVIVEPHNDDFLQAWFEDPNGNLYENADAYCDVTDVSCMEVEENDEGNDDALRALGVDARLEGAAWTAAMKSRLDWDRWIAYLALERTIVHWDSYSYDLSNYQLYHEPSRDKWTFLTQSMDLDFGFRPWSYPDCGMYGMDMDRYDMGMLASACELDEECITGVAAAAEAYADQLEAADGAAQVRELDALIGNAVRADPRRYYDDRDYEDHVACLQAFFDERPAQVRAWASTFRD